VVVPDHVVIMPPAPIANGAGLIRAARCACPQDSWPAWAASLECPSAKKSIMRTVPVQIDAGQDGKMEESG
jgi:hypothetical protein